ncbi:hypothetical protein ACIBBD_01745 [Streptomyces sp. NPDC051315]|uniref:hypothetical protein n=1 Tax=Streptomyces sp. NPDC051315 TaxID=3365650 RepID=UPI00379030EB
MSGIGGWIRLAGAAAVGVGVVLSVTGCSGQETAQRPGAGAKGTEGRALGREELRNLAFRNGEVPNSHGSPVQSPAPGPERTFPPVSDASCQTVLDVLDAKGASAVVRQVFNWKDDLWGGASTLASYEDAGARQVFERLEKGLRTCRSYSGRSYAGAYTTEVTGVDGPRAGRVGDEALTFRTVTPTKDGLVMHHDYVVVRTAGVIATFRKADEGREATFPRDLVERQVDRLADAQRS